MANFDGATAKEQSVRDANNLLAHIRGLYASCKSAQALMTRYQGGADPVFNGAVNSLFNASERAELVAMLGPINSLVTDWEANHAGAIGIA